MAIHRVGQPTDRPTPSTDLGRILVTIDDLEALFKLLGDHTPTEVRARFNGGHFTDPHDLRSLSDGELSYLSVETSSAQVHLRSNRASVVSPDDEIRSKVEHWASTRQTDESARNYQRDERERGRAALAFAALIAALSAISVAAFIYLQHTYPGDQLNPRWPLGLAGAWGTLGVSFFWLVAEVARLGDHIPTYAVIEPITAAEYRSRTQAAKQPSRANLIAAVSALAAVVAIGVTLYLAYFPPK